MANIEVVVGERACIEEAKRIKDQLLEAFDKAKAGDTVIFNLDKTRQADTSLAQILIAAEAEAKLRKLIWRLKDRREDKSLSSLLYCDFTCESCSVRDIHSKIAARRPT